MRVPVAIGVALAAFVGPSIFTASRTLAVDAQPADDQATAELREHVRHHHLGGVTQFIAMSLDTLGEDDAKRPQVEKIQGNLYGCMAPVGSVEKELHLLLADGVAAGAVDGAKVDATIERLSTAASAVHDCSVEALNELHEVLSPAERAELAEKVHAHWEVWQLVNHRAKAGDREHGGRVAELTQELSLTPEQAEKVSAALEEAFAGSNRKFDRKKAAAHVQTLVSAVPKKSFDAKKIAMGPNPHFAAYGAKRMATFYETVTPVLTPEQRTTLAEHLREHANQQPALSAK